MRVCDLRPPVLLGDNWIVFASAPCPFFSLSFPFFFFFFFTPLAILVNLVRTFPLTAVPSPLGRSRQSRPFYSHPRQPNAPRKHASTSTHQERIPPVSSLARVCSPPYHLSLLTYTLELHPPPTLRSFPAAGIKVACHRSAQLAIRRSSCLTPAEPLGCFLASPPSYPT